MAIIPMSRNSPVIHPVLSSKGEAVCKLPTAQQTWLATPSELISVCSVLTQVFNQNWESEKLSGTQTKVCFKAQSQRETDNMAAS